MAQQFDCTFYNELYCEGNLSDGSAGSAGSAGSDEDDRLAVAATDYYVCLPEPDEQVVQETTEPKKMWYPPEPKINTYFKKIVKENTRYGATTFWLIVKTVLQQLIHLNNILPEEEAVHELYASAFLKNS